METRGLLELNNNKYLVFTFNPIEKIVSYGRFLTIKNNSKVDFQMLRDIDFNGECKIGDILEFDIVALPIPHGLENKLNLLRLNFLRDKNKSNIETNELVLGKVRYTINPENKSQDILDKNGNNVVGKISMELEPLETKNSFIYCFPYLSIHSF